MTELGLSSDLSAPVSRGRGSIPSLLTYFELAKPRVTRMVVLTTGLGMFAAPGPHDWVHVTMTLLGMALVVAGANALNMFIERDSDGLMSRTRARPLPSGRMQPEVALALGVGWSLLGLVAMAHYSGVLAFSLAAFSLLSYVLLYTPLKRVGPVSLYVGAVPGALPPAIGYVSATGRFDRVALCLFLILFVWQLPHFLAIALFRASEYERAGLQVMSVARGLPATRRAMVLFALLLLLVTLLPLGLGLGGTVYGVIAAVSGVAFALLAAYGGLRQAGSRWARAIFFGSMPHLVLVLAALVLSIQA